MTTTDKVNQAATIFLCHIHCTALPISLRFNNSKDKNLPLTLLQCAALSILLHKMATKIRHTNKGGANVMYTRCVH